MKKVITERSIRTGAGKYLAQLYADAAAELAGVTELDGVELDSGSLALTADGKLCILDSAGVWHDMSDGSEIEIEVSGDE